jgi:hypothetical protein
LASGAAALDPSAATALALADARFVSLGAFILGGEKRKKGC